MEVFGNHDDLSKETKRGQDSQLQFESKELLENGDQTKIAQKLFSNPSIDFFQIPINENGYSFKCAAFELMNGNLMVLYEQTGPLYKDGTKTDEIVTNYLRQPYKNNANEKVSIQPNESELLELDIKAMEFIPKQQTHHSQGVNIPINHLPLS